MTRPGYPPTTRFPAMRPRRLRQAEWARRLAREITLSTDDLVRPLFVSDSAKGRQPIDALPGQHRSDIASLIEDARRSFELDIPAIALFPHIREDLKTVDGAEAANPDGLVQTAVRELKSALPDLAVIVDVALDPYTDHGHDGILDRDTILNDATADALVQVALSLVEAGADIIAPSDMMDGRVGRIRQALEEHRHSERHLNMPILSYAAKYASGFYGPYRDAIGTSAALRGDKRTYQMDPMRRDEALAEVGLDLEEGADMVMVKPGLPYLDIIGDIRATFGVPTFAFQVSGEYAMIRAAAERGMIDEQRVMMETMMSFKRAGASGVFTYFADDIAEALQSGYPV